MAKQALLGGQRLMQLLDLEREANGRQLPPELAEQMVVASAAADRHADRRVVDLEHRAGVVAGCAR